MTMVLTGGTYGRGADIQAWGDHTCNSPEAYAQDMGFKVDAGPKTPTFG